MDNSQFYETSWAMPTLREVPFWRDDLTPVQYEIERDYMCEKYDLVLNNRYKPLWAILTPEEYKAECDYYIDNIELAMSHKYTPLWKQRENAIQSTHMPSQEDE